MNNLGGRRKPNIQIDDPEFSYQEFNPVKIDSTAGDCCALAKEVWDKLVKEYLSDHRNMRANDIIESLSVNHLDCKTFFEMLTTLSKVVGSGDVIVSINNILSKYLRLNKVPTSLFSLTANAAKYAAIEALTEWRRCLEKNKELYPEEENFPESFDTINASWKSTLSKDEYQYQTWDNTLKALKCPECKEGELELTTYQKKHAGSRGSHKAIMTCNKCGHKERFV